MGYEVKPSLTHFLISCSFAPSARQIIKQGYNLARLLDAKVTFCHVGIDRPQTLSEVRLMLTDIGVDQNISIIIKPGSPHKVLTSVAKEVGADLIIAGALKHEGSLVGIFGSVARRLVRQAHCSVLLVMSDSQEVLSKGSVCVAIDYQKSSYGLMNLALNIAKSRQETLHIVHENDYHLKFLEFEEIGDDRRIQAYKRECDTVEKDKLTDFIQQFNVENIKIKQACLNSDEGSVLSNYCQKSGVKILLINAPKEPLSWLYRIFNQSVEVVLQDLPCSILFYKQ